MDKNCLFQYATAYHFDHFGGGSILCDTDLITLNEAKELWHKNKDDFIKRLENGEDPEMCIWVDCNTNTDYKKCIWHACYDAVVKNGELYDLQRIDYEKN